MKIIYESTDEKKKKAQGWFTTLGGNPEVSKDKFNHALGSDKYDSGTSSDNSGEGATGEGVSTSGGMGESLIIESAPDRNAQIEFLKSRGLRYNFNKFPDKQIFAIYQKELKKAEIPNNKNDSNAKFNWFWIDSFEDEDIYEDANHHIYKIDGVDNRTFPTIEDAKDYIKGIGEY